MELFEINYSGKKLRVWAEKQGQSIWLHYLGKTICVPMAKTSRTDSGSGSSVGSGEISAPMPGKILKVKCKRGDKVQSGDVLIVMEAMKMEYSLAAEISGEIALLTCKEGDQVQKDSLLVRVEA